MPNVRYSGERPSLPSGMPERTREWWETISTMPHCALWHPSDWQFAIDTAILHAAFVKGDLARAAELRKWERILGVGIDARRSQRIRYVDPPPEPEPEDTEVTNIADERHRRLGRSDD